MLPHRPGELVAGNPFTRTWVVGDAAFVELLASAAGEPRERAQVEGEFAGRAIRARDAGVSPFVDGLLGDPTGLDREATLDGVEPLEAKAAVELALRLSLIVEDETAYRESFGPRRNVLDRSKRGTMHQQVGEHVMLRLRERDPDVWWARQKFTEDLREPREGPYRFVQWRFMQDEYGSRDMSGQRVLDLGCGPGLFARLFASRGAEVVGLDTQPDHLANAGRLAEDDGLAERVRLEELEIPVERTLGPMAAAGEKFDLIFLSDVMMFYFHPYDPALELDPVALLRQLVPLLAAGGSITVLEPEGTFWQQPWLGDPERPFTVLTEYRHRRYGVTPTLEQLSRAAEDAGLRIARIRELVPDREVAASGRRDAGFAAEFPLWWFFDLRTA